MNRFFQSHIQNLQLTTVKMAYVTCLVTKNFTFELPGKCVISPSKRKGQGPGPGTGAGAGQECGHWPPNTTHSIHTVVPS